MTDVATKPKLEDLDTLYGMWQEDAIVEELELNKEAIKIPMLQSKWLKIHHRHNLRARNLENKYKKLKRDKWRYYSGKMNQEELKERGWNPFEYILKNDVDLFLEGDDDLITMGSAVFYHQEVVSFCKSVLKELNNRHWQIKAAIDFMKFTSGS